MVAFEAKLGALEAPRTVNGHGSAGG
jgi:hypothetical protein